MANRTTPSQKNQKKPSTARLKRERSGRIGEVIAAAWLILKGYRIVKTRAKTPVGEVDLVCKKNGTLIAVEVKSRPTLDEALSALERHRWERTARALQWWLANQSGAEAGTGLDGFYRVDAIARAGLRIKHVQNVSVADQVSSSRHNSWG